MSCILKLMWLDISSVKQKDGWWSGWRAKVEESYYLPMLQTKFRKRGSEIRPVEMHNFFTHGWSRQGPSKPNHLNHKDRAPSGKSWLSMYLSFIRICIIIYGILISAGDLNGSFINDYGKLNIFEKISLTNNAHI